MNQEKSKLYKVYTSAEVSGLKRKYLDSIHDKRRKLNKLQKELNKTERDLDLSISTSRFLENELRDVRRLKNVFKYTTVIISLGYISTILSIIFLTY
jgi:hypothetical protein